MPSSRYSAAADLGDSRPGHGCLIIWSSLWQKRPDARVRFGLASDGAAGTRLRWTLHVAEPMPDPSLLGHMRKRLNELINANLRYTFGH